MYDQKDKEKIRKLKRLSLEDFYFKYVPSPGWIIQGYLFSLILFVSIGKKYFQDLDKIKNGFKQNN